MEFSQKWGFSFKYCSILLHHSLSSCLSYLLSFGNLNYCFFMTMLGLCCNIRYRQQKPKILSSYCPHSQVRKPWDLDEQVRNGNTNKQWNEQIFITLKKQLNCYNIVDEILQQSQNSFRKNFCWELSVQYCSYSDMKPCSRDTHVQAKSLHFLGITLKNFSMPLYGFCKDVSNCNRVLVKVKALQFNSTEFAIWETYKCYCSSIFLSRFHFLKGCSKSFSIPGLFF